jgi:hypothetical protein
MGSGVSRQFTIASGMVVLSGSVFENKLLRQDPTPAFPCMNSPLP